MRFGGHQTFSIREGWLHKGLRMLQKEPELLTDEYAADWLGVGRNMAKSINHWLLATGFARLVPDEQKPKKMALRPTDLADLVYANDVSFSELGTWWAIHINLANSPNYAASWGWFFNSFHLAKFEKAVCLEGLRRWLPMSKTRMPSINTLDRDIRCLLGSYSERVPSVREDPEEGRDCPLIELGLMKFFPNSGSYTLNRDNKEIPSDLLGYCLAKSAEAPSNGQRTMTISFDDAVQCHNGPGHLFALSSESLYEFVLRIESEEESEDIQIEGLAGERVIRYSCKDALEWLAGYYEKIA